MSNSVMSNSGMSNSGMSKSNQNHYHFRSAMLLSSLMSLFGCVLGPNHHTPEMSLPEEFKHKAAFDTTVDPTNAQAVPNIDLATWWESLDDPMLTELIKEALKSNLDLKLALARVREARSELDFVIGGYLPQIGVHTSAKRSKSNVGTTADSSGTEPVTATGKPTNIFQANFDSLWEFNIFGVGRAIESSEASLEAQEDATRFVQISLIAELAKNYTTLRGLQQQRAIAIENVNLQKQTWELQQLKLQAGTATELSVAQAEGQLSSNEATIPQLDSQISQAIHRIAVLLGKNPEELEAELSPDGPLPKGPATDSVIPVGLPSELLRRRPDVRQAENVLHAATANIGLAISDLFPSISLTGALGFQSRKLSTLTDSVNDFWNLGAAIDFPLFNAEKFAQIEIQNAQQEQALIVYKQVVLLSLSEVEDSLVALDREQARRDLLRKTVAANQHAFDLAQRLNQAGIIDFLNVITAQQALFESQNQLSISEQAVSVNLIAVYKALGGGWDVKEIES